MSITQIIYIILTLIMGVLAYVIVPTVKSKLSYDKLEYLKKWAKIAVYAAEQLFDGEGRGADKKEYVTTFLESKGFKVDAESLDLIIESMVYEMNDKTDLLFEYDSTDDE